MEEEGRCDQDTEDADAGEPGPDGEGAGEYLELGNETSEARQSQAGEGSEDRGCRQFRRDLRETAVGFQVVFACALPEPAGDEEKRSGDEAVRHHLDQRAGQGTLTRRVAAEQRAGGEIGRASGRARGGQYV